MKKIILFLTVILMLLAMCSCAITPMSFFSMGNNKADDYTDSYESDDYDVSYETAEEQSTAVAEDGNISAAMEGWWQVASGGDFHEICINRDGGWLKLQDGSDEVTVEYTAVSNTEIQIGLDGELFSFILENGKLVRYENGVADGYVYEWIGSL